MEWTLESNSVDPKEVEIYKFVATREPELARNIVKFISLHSFLESNQFTDSDELRKSVTSNGKPIFTKDEAKILFEKTLKRGGNVEVMDKIVRNFMNWAYGWTPAILADGIDAVDRNAGSYIFIASILEKDPRFGAMFSLAMNSLTSLLPSIAIGIENVTPEIIGFLPIPEAGPVGGVIGWMIGSMVAFFAMLIHLSREHFGQAFLLSFTLIPFVGTTLYSAAQSGEKFVVKTSADRDRLIESARNFLGDDTADTLSNVLPDLTAEPPPLPVRELPAPIAALIPESIPTLDDIKARAFDTVAQAGLPTSLDEAKAKVAQAGLPASLDEAKAQVALATYRKNRGDVPTGGRHKSRRHRHRRTRSRKPSRK